jgi:CRP/FNR family transcriptional regulator
MLVGHHAAELRLTSESSPSRDTYLEQGDVLYSPQDGTQRLFILKKGRVQVYEVDRSGEEITLSVVEGGSVFGEMALTGQSLEGLYVRALVPSTVVSSSVRS